MRVHVIQHVSFEGLGNLRMALEGRHAQLQFTYMQESQALPPLEQIDLIVIMGGPMSVNDEADYPWLVAEKRWIADALERNIPMLGICLGAQLIACALGASVGPNAQKEIGWFDVDGNAGDANCFNFPGRFRCFHWHGETFSLPQGAVRLASSEACDNQAFQYGRRVIGLQFHPETTETSMHGLIERLGHELSPAPFVQSAEQMCAEPAGTYIQISNLSDQLLKYLLDS